jgi:RNA polymerase sigma-70 factor (subfamily 1)
MDVVDCQETVALLRRALHRDDEAWSLLVIQHGERLRGLARFLLDRRLKARFDPEDMVQETFADAFQLLQTFFEQPLPFHAWLDQRLRDRIHRLHRDHRGAECRSVRREAHAFCGSESSAPALVACLPDPGTSPSGRAMRAENGDVLRQAFPALSPLDCEILGMFFIEGRGHHEIETILDLKPNTVNQRLCRATAHLTTLLRRAHPEWCHAFEIAAQRGIS